MNIPDRFKYEWSVMVVGDNFVKSKDKNTERKIDHGTRYYPEFRVFE